jgi:hypothetical protein
MSPRVANRHASRLSHAPHLLVVLFKDERSHPGDQLEGILESEFSNYHIPLFIVIAVSLFHINIFDSQSFTTHTSIVQVVFRLEASRFHHFEGVVHLLSTY